MLFRSDLLAGDVLNNLLDTLGKNQEFFCAVADLINNMPVNKFMVTDSNNKIDYLGFGDGFSVGGSLLQLALGAGLQIDAAKKLSLSLTDGLKISGDSLALNIADGLTIDEQKRLSILLGNGLRFVNNALSINLGNGFKFEDGKTTLNIDDSLMYRNNLLSIAALISLSRTKKLSGSIITPEIFYTIFKYDLTDNTTFTFNNTNISGLAAEFIPTFELHINMPAVKSFAFNPVPEWDGGETPDFSEPGEYWLVFRTENKGGSWKASLGSKFNAHTI